LVPSLAFISLVNPFPGFQALTFLTEKIPSYYTIAKKHVRMGWGNLNEHKWVSYDER
jgi:hypothetical protein